MLHLLHGEGRPCNSVTRQQPPQDKQSPQAKGRESPQDVQSPQAKGRKPPQNPTMRRPPQKKSRRRTAQKPVAKGRRRFLPGKKKNGCGLRDESSDATSHRFREEFIRKTTPEGPETADRRPAYRGAHSLRHIAARTHTGVPRPYPLRRPSAIPHA